MPAAFTSEAVLGCSGLHPSCHNPLEEVSSGLSQILVEFLLLQDLSPALRALHQWCSREERQVPHVPSAAQDTSHPHHTKRGNCSFHTGPWNISPGNLYLGNPEHRWRNCTYPQRASQSLWNSHGHHGTEKLHRKSLPPITEALRCEFRGQVDVVEEI